MNRNRALIVLAAGTLLASCDVLEPDFEDINQDPNRVTDVTPQSLLTAAIYDITWDNMQFGHRLANEFVQYSVHNSELNEYHRYDVPHTQSNTFWSRYYRHVLDAADMEARAEEVGASNYVAIGKILKSLAFTNLTDIFGPVPYHEALQGDQGGPLQPAFDSQEAVYTAILAELEEANTLFDPEEGIDGDYDILFQGDLAKWQKFGNSLLLRLLLRVSGRSEMDAPARIAQILADPAQYPIITSNDDAAILRYTGTRPNVSPFYDWRALEFNGNRRATAFMIETLEELDDPRLGRYLMPNEEGAFVGIPSGWAEHPPTNSATYNDALKNADQPAILLSHAEVELIRAEAALRGWTDEDAAVHYANGIESSMQFWGDEMPAGYLDQAGARFDGELSTLMLQKWIALFWSGLEGWHEYRRTGYPELTAGPGAKNDDIVPTRLRFPSTVQTLNAANYQDAVSMLGGDDNLQTPVWWAR